MMNVKETVKYLNKFGVEKDEQAVRYLLRLGKEKGGIDGIAPPEDKPKEGYKVPIENVDEWLSENSPTFVLKKIEMQCKQLEKENAKLKRTIEIKDNKISNLENKISTLNEQIKSFKKANKTKKVKDVDPFKTKLSKEDDEWLEKEESRTPHDIY